MGFCVLLHVDACLWLRLFVTWWLHRIDRASRLASAKIYVVARLSWKDLKFRLISFEKCASGLFFLNTTQIEACLYQKIRIGTYPGRIELKSELVCAKNVYRAFHRLNRYRLSVCLR